MVECDPMQAASADPRAPQPTQESFGISEGLMRSHLNNEVLEKFAQSMAENIIQSFISQMEIAEPEVDCGVSRFNQKQEMLAEELASAVMEVALREVCLGRNVEEFKSSRSAGVRIGQSESKGYLPDMDTEKDPGYGIQISKDTKRNVGDHLEFQSSRSAGVRMDRSESHGDPLDMDTEMDQGREIQVSKDAKTYHPPLSQSGLPIVGSLDYPDAPPTTPLLPELERSRCSFARKLKGGLAKVFLPSPPPPTPKDDSDSAANDPQTELMEHLMHSLPTDDLASDYYEVGPHHGAKVEAFAEALSCNIINWVLSAKNREQIADDADLHLLAQQLAETIITSSLDEARVLI